MPPKDELQAIGCRQPRRTASGVMPARRQWRAIQRWASSRRRTHPGWGRRRASSAWSICSTKVPVPSIRGSARTGSFRWRMARTSAQPPRERMRPPRARGDLYVSLQLGHALTHACSRGDGEGNPVPSGRRAWYSCERAGRSASGVDDGAANMSLYIRRARGRPEAGKGTHLRTRDMASAHGRGTSWADGGGSGHGCSGKRARVTRRPANSPYRVF
jgi:hypothetical protein